MKYESLSEESECSSAIPSAGGELASESLRFRAEEVLPTAYDGNANYIFVSYAHRDSDVVMPVLAYLIRRGYNVWYDEGITPGTDWDEFLDKKIKGSSCFLCFISGRSLASQECLKEISRAQKYGIAFLNVFLEPCNIANTSLSYLLQVQGIEKWRCSRETDFYVKLLTHDLFDDCREGQEFLIQEHSLIKYNGLSSDICIPNGVTEIDYAAFEGNDRITRIFIPADIDRIGKFAFSNMRALQRFEVENNNGFFASVDGVLYNKARNYIIRYPSARPGASYRVPSGVKNIQILAFSETADLQQISIPESVTMIGDRAFESCVNLVSIDLFADVKILKPYTFSRCSGLIGIDLPPHLEVISDGVFSGCASLREIALPSSVRKIGEMAFAYCKNLTTVILPEKLKVIPEYCFHESSGLKKMDLSKVIRIEQYAFKNCESLEELTFGEGLTCIGRAAFSGCASLCTLNLPDSLEIVEAYSFDRCSNLSIVRCGRGVKSIEEGSFEGDYAMEQIYVPSTIEHIAQTAIPENAEIIYY